MNDTIQLALEGGGSIALPRAQLAEQLATDIITNLQTKAAQQVPAYPLGQFVSSQGGIYVGARLIDGRVHHRFIAPREQHPTEIKFDDVGRAVASMGRIGGLDGWRPGDQEDLMLAYINARGHFPTSGQASIYWTSAPFGSTNAWALDFEDGHVYPWDRSLQRAVLPVRSSAT